jgi:Asp-tRNA(Asn)/Glu-tRNA(Gln) amidotransferase A subunit family amidase
VTQLCDATGADLTSKLAAGETSAVEILASTHVRIDAVEDEVRAFLTPTPQLAHERAEELDTYLATGAPQSPAAAAATSNGPLSKEQRTKSRHSSTLVGPLSNLLD